MSTELPEPTTAVIVGPTDRLLLVAPADADQQQLKNLAAAFRETWGDDRVIVLSGPLQLAVLKDGATDRQETQP